MKAILTLLPKHPIAQRGLQIGCSSIHLGSIMMGKANREDGIMDIWPWFGSLSMFEKIGLIGTLASIVSLALYFLPVTTSSQSQPSNSAITTGDQSPAIGTNTGNVNYYNSAPVKEKSYVLRNARSGVTPLLDSPNLVTTNFTSH